MTNAYSNKAPKTKVTHTPDQTSMAFVYATGGNDELMEACVVDMAKRVVTPKATLAGTLKNEMLLREIIKKLVGN